MSTRMRALIDRNLDAVMAKDLDAAVSAFSSNGILIDPHYPHTRMTGRAEIESGFRWVFTQMKELRFTVLTCYYSEDGESAAVEVASHHVLANGRRLEFPQCFVVDAEGDLVDRWQAYEPFGPNGIGGLLLGIGRLSHRLRNRG